MGLLRTLLWIGLFLVCTFAFTVLFEYGPSNYVANSQKEWDSLMEFYHAKTGDTAAKPAKTP